MLKAIRDGVVRPLGTVGRVTLIGASEEDLDELRRLLSSPSPAPSAGHIG
jgi:hypothetical protein